MKAQIFISHVEEDQALAVAAAEALEGKGYTTWYYERDSLPGPPYLEQASDAIEQAAAVLLLISESSIGAYQVTAEVVHAFESRRSFLPLLHQFSHAELRQRNRTWAMALGASVSIAIPPGGPTAVVERMVSGLKQLGIVPGPLPDAGTADTLRPDEGVICTVVAPLSHGADGAALVQVWLHTAEQEPDVSARAADFDPAARRRAFIKLMAHIPRGTILTVQVTVGDLAVRALTSRATWQGDALPLVFRVEAPQRTDRLIQVGRVHVVVGGMPIADVNVLLQFAPALAATASERPELVWRARMAFLSYANDDQAEVVRRVGLLSTLGIEPLRNEVSLDTGDSGDEQIRRTIDRADKFLLFWSHAASRSPHVEREWRYALESKGLSFIMPIAIETPMPPPPEELATLHFGRGIASIVPE